MNQPSANRFVKILDRFEPGLVHTGFPHIDAIQLDRGPFAGWIFTAPVGAYRVNIGTSNRTLLYEGHYNPEMVHVGLIFSQEHAAVVHGHSYSSGLLAIHGKTALMHEIFPPGMAWADISVPETIMLDGIPDLTKRTVDSPRLLLDGSRRELIPLIEVLKECLVSPHSQGLSVRLHSALRDVLTRRFAASVELPRFSSGDLFQAHLLEKIHQMVATYKTTPHCLDEICSAVRMKPRTLQKYFYASYGMGPTEYFRIRRLNGARADLLSGGETVSRVALRWKFAHLGRFSGRYKAHFGESPRETLAYAVPEGKTVRGETGTLKNQLPFVVRMVVPQPL